MDVIGMMEKTDLGMGDWGFVLFCVAVMAVVGGMGFVAVRMARGSRWREVILAGTVLWGVLMAGSVIYSGIDERRYEREKAVAMESGYYEKSDWTGVRRPWLLWGGMVLAWGALLFAAAINHRGTESTETHRGDEKE